MYRLIFTPIGPVPFKLYSDEEDVIKEWCVAIKTSGRALNKEYTGNCLKYWARQECDRNKELDWPTVKKVIDDNFTIQQELVQEEQKIPPKRKCIYYGEKEPR